MKRNTIAKFLILSVFTISLILAQGTDGSSVDPAGNSDMNRPDALIEDKTSDTSNDSVDVVDNQIDDELNQEIYKSFQDYLHQYNVTYSTIEEMDERYNIFSDNYIYVKKQNALNSTDYLLGVNEFFGMTEDEFSEKYLNKDLDEKEVELAQQPTKESMITTLDLSEEMVEKFLSLPSDPPAIGGHRMLIDDLPESWDWRSKGAVTKVKNQGACGSCWSFATIGNLEGRYFLKNGTLETLSEQALMSCDAYNTQGCRGGVLSSAFLSLIRGKSALVRESEYTYTAKKGICNIFGKTVIAKVRSYQFAGTTDEDAIARMLMKYGPLSAEINARGLLYYKKGIYDKTAAVCNPKALNHGVLLVGWGIEGDKKYWIVKNTWGSKWGENGYFRIARGKGTCGINRYIITGNLA